MTTARDQLLRSISDLLSGRPVRWAQNVTGDYDGRERTLEVFNADAAEQRDLFRRLRAVRKDMEAQAGGPVIVIFHTSRESARLYADFVRQALISEVTEDIALAQRQLDIHAPALGNDVAVQPRRGDSGSGSHSLPRRAA